MRRTAPPSRPYGRYPVGLRPSLDPDAYFDAPSQDKEARRTNPNNTPRLAASLLVPRSQSEQALDLVAGREAGKSNKREQPHRSAALRRGLHLVVPVEQEVRQSPVLEIVAGARQLVRRLAHVEDRDGHRGRRLGLGKAIDVVAHLDLVVPGRRNHRHDELEQVSMRIDGGRKVNRLQVFSGQRQNGAGLESLEDFGLARTSPMLVPFLRRFAEALHNSARHPLTADARRRRAPGRKSVAAALPPTPAQAAQVCAPPTNSTGLSRLILP
jgi:hypothetical protein